MCKILIADDEYLEREALKMIINSEIQGKIEFIEAINGKEALELNSRLNPDILILNIKIPLINGLEVAEKIRTKDKDKIIIIFTAYDDKNYIEKALNIKVNEYLLKPVRPEKIIEVLQKYITSDRLICTSQEIENALVYIEERYRENISLDEVAKYINLTPSYVSKLFKKKLGVNFNTYLTTRKINEAKRMLKEENENINEIAFIVGYNEPNYFCKVFKKIEGITPTKFRQNIAY
ncbi:response regulator transcription factor [Clostridium sp.]|jgi:two-component system response regulator YesN|uniref:response regulator transcription factor n=1 Tax=Clostridium sp. TaxID=1506 RepID=UPI003EEE73C1